LSKEHIPIVEFYKKIERDIREWNIGEGRTHFFDIYDVTAG